MINKSIQYYQKEIRRLQPETIELQKKYSINYTEYLLFKQNIGCLESLDCRVIPLLKEQLTSQEELNKSLSIDTTLPKVEMLHGTLTEEISLIEKAIADIQRAVDSLTSDMESMEKEIPILQKENKELQKKYELLRNTYDKYGPFPIQLDLPQSSPTSDSRRYALIKNTYERLCEEQKSLKEACKKLELAIADCEQKKLLLPLEIYELMLKYEELIPVYTKLYESYLTSVEKSFIAKIEFTKLDNTDLQSLINPDQSYLTLSTNLKAIEQQVSFLKNACQELESAINKAKTKKEALQSEILDLALQNKDLEESYTSTYRNYNELAEYIEIPKEELLLEKDFSTYDLSCCFDQSASLTTLTEGKKFLLLKKKEIQESHNVLIDALCPLVEKLEKKEEALEELVYKNIALKEKYDELRRTYKKLNTSHPLCIQPVPLEDLPSYNIEQYKMKIRAAQYPVLKSISSKLSQEYKIIEKACKVLEKSINETQKKLIQKIKPLKKIEVTSQSESDFFSLEDSFDLITEPQGIHSSFITLGVAASMFFIALVNSKRAS